MNHDCSLGRSLGVHASPGSRTKIRNQAGLGVETSDLFIICRGVSCYMFYRTMRSYTTLFATIGAITPAPAVAFVTHPSRRIGTACQAPSIIPTPQTLPARGETAGLAWEPRGDITGILTVAEAASPTYTVAQGDNIMNIMKIHSGTLTHIVNAILCMSLLSSHSVRRSLNSMIMKGSFAGLVTDNVINASGKYIGDGIALRKLTRVRLVLHGLTVPSLYVPVIDAAAKSGLLTLRASRIAKCFALAYAFIEFVDWCFLFDVNHLTKSSAAMPGTLVYTSGKIFKLVMPPVVLQFFTMLVGHVLCGARCAAGPRFFSAGVVGLVAGSIAQAARRPDIQVCGETASLSLMWAALLCIPN